MHLNYTKLKTAFASQKNHARQRGIIFLLTFEEWLNIWITSKKLNQRGRKKGQYCMARYGDVGPYSIDNVEIIVSQLNTSIGNRGKIISENQKSAIRLANSGKKFKRSQAVKDKKSKAMKEFWAKKRTC